MLIISLFTSIQDYHLGLFRSDYLLHTDPSSASSSPPPPSIRQVEFNTISSSFGPLCATVGQLHRHLLQQTGYYGVSPSLQEDRLPHNGALQLLAAGLAEAHKTYIAQHGSAGSSPRILFVVQEQERNAFDQRWLEYELLDRHGIRSIRRTFTSLIKDAQVDAAAAPPPPPSSSSSSGSGAPRRLKVQTESESDPIEVSTIYYRSGYAPSDYTSPDNWSLRLNLERSSAIKCPTVALQLAGAKKVQQVLSEPGVVEQFLPHASQDDISQLKSTWAGLYPLDDTSELGRQGLELAQNPDTAISYVMKPQREGGGNNIYRSDIPTALTAMSQRDAQRTGGAGEDNGTQPKEREGYILMELITPPTGLGNYLLRPPPPPTMQTQGQETSEPSTSTTSTKTILSGLQSQHHEGLTTSECRLSPDVVSELGIYGVALFKRVPNGASLDEKTYYHQPQNDDDTQQENQNQKPAYLLRTKGRESDEGGVAVGFSVLDSVLLV